MNRAGGWTRRAALAAAASAAVSACASTRDLAAHASLDALARQKGMRFGCAVGRPDLDNQSYVDLVRRECGEVVPENDLKWPVVHPGSGVYDFAPGDRLVAFAAQNHMRVRGHNLVWHHPRWLPGWVSNYDFGADPRPAAEALLHDHIVTICRHYGDRIQSWDVVNETIDEHTGALRETVFTRAMGAEVTGFCFHAAREAAPQAQLVYNDYMGWEQSSAAHRDGVLRLLHDLKNEDAPVDALGLQSHLSAGAAIDEAAWRAFLDEVTGMGYALLITELDVNDRGLPAAAHARDQAVADTTRRYLDLTLSYTQVKDVLTWGIEDGRSWLQSFTPRDDHVPLRPLPYDAAYRPKPMRAAIAEAFRNAPAR